MNVASLASRAVAVLSSWKRTEPSDVYTAMPQKADTLRRNSAAFAFSCYWARCHEGWSLVVFRCASGVAGYVACETPDGTIVDARGQCSEDQIAALLGMPVTVSYGAEAEVQLLLGSNMTVLEAADELRQRVEQEAALR